MKYIELKNILAVVGGLVCLVLVGFVIKFGVDYSKRVSGVVDENKLKAAITENVKKAEKKETKKENTKKVETKTETKTTKKVSDGKLEGKYIIKELTYNNEKYSTEEIESMIDEGYSLKLEILSGGIANLSVLSINNTYVIEDNSFVDGVGKYGFSFDGNELKVMIDDTYMVFEKE